MGKSYLNIAQKDKDIERKRVKGYGRWNEKRCTVHILGVQWVVEEWGKECINS